MPQRSIAIAGAGIAGLAAALLLHRDGLWFAGFTAAMVAGTIFDPRRTLGLKS